MTRTPDGRPGTDFPADLVATGVVGLASVVVVLAHLDPLRMILGWTLPLLVPGYALMCWLYPSQRRASDPNQRSLGHWERLGLGVVASIALTGVLGFALNFTPAGITLATMAFGLGLTTLLFLVLATDARLKVPPEARPRFAFGMPQKDSGPRGRTSPAMALLLAVSFTGLLIVAMLLLPYKEHVDAYTNAYVLGGGGKTSCLPDTYNATAGFSIHPVGRATCPLNTDQVTIGIVNHEGRLATYFVKVFWSAPSPNPEASLEAKPLASFSIQLGPLGAPSIKPMFERQYEHNVTLTAPPLSGLNRLNIQFFKDFGSGVAATPDQFLYLYVAAP